MLDIPNTHTIYVHLHMHTLTQPQTASKLIQTAEYLTSENQNSFIFSSLGGKKRAVGLKLFTHNSNLNV